jgi:L-serine/L-threonine ammonia-lyase
MSEQLHIETAILENPSMNKRLGKRIFMKMECYQPVGSFKIRGIGAVCQAAVASGKTHLISSSGGNAGYAAAYAGRQLGVKVTVVVPESTGETARARIASEDAEVIVHGAVWQEANELALELVKKYDGAYIHPFDNPIVWSGHARMIDEIVQQCPKPDVLLVAVGGGGLMSGVIEGLHKNNWQDVPVLAVETEGAASLGAAMQAGELVQLDSITSIAKTLGASQVASQAFEWTKKHPVQSVVVSDTEAVNACLQFADDMRVVVEPACGAALSLLYDNQHYLKNYNNVLAIICGGAGVTIGQLLARQSVFS